MCAINTDMVAASIEPQHQCLLHVVIVYEACAQNINSFYYFWMVVTCAAFGLLIVSVFWGQACLYKKYSNYDMKGDDSLSRLHTY